MAYRLEEGKETTKIYYVVCNNLSIFNIITLNNRMNYIAHIPYARRIKLRIHGFLILLAYKAATEALLIFCHLSWQYKYTQGSIQIIQRFRKDSRVRRVTPKIANQLL